MKLPILVLGLAVSLLAGCAAGTRSGAAAGPSSCPPAYNGCFAD